MQIPIKVSIIQKLHNKINNIKIDEYSKIINGKMNKGTHIFLANEKKYVKPEINMYFLNCKKCGNYLSTNISYDKLFSKYEKIYCTCYNNSWEKKCLQINRNKFHKVLKEMIEKIDDDNEDDSPYLGPCCYYHEGECSPDNRRCKKCWRYWCGTCGGGLGGMMGECNYKNCIVGRQNYLRYGEIKKKY